MSQMRTKPDLVAKWSKRENDILYHWQAGSKTESRLVAYALETAGVFKGNSLRRELQERGYDITTLKFSIRRRAGLSAESKEEEQG